MQKVVFIGSGGVAREVISWAHDMVEIVGCATLDPDEHARFGLPGPVLPDDLTPATAGTDLAVMAIGLPSVKRKLHQKLSAAGFRFQTLVHPSAVVAHSVSVGEGTVICPFVNVSPNVVLGDLSYVNFCVGIGHDVEIGRFVQINPGVQIGGFTKIGEGALIGSGSTVREGLSIGENSTVGSGSVVFGPVRSNVTVIGNPARRMRAFED
jgi:sugar O-acyltransferase (sialic acid O-acetyltransferase NeuD family)